jgi:putative ABC transport system substrate-binding protein
VFLATVTRLSLVVVVLTLVAPLSAGAQQAAKVYRIGYLSSGPSTSNLFVEPFREGLRAHGWAEGQNVIIDYRFAEGRSDRLPELAAELVRLKVDVIVAAPTPPAVAAKNATGTIPIVMVGGGDPVALGLVVSLARPGGNVTGLAFGVGMATFGKGLELLKEAVPKAHRMAVLSNPANPAQPVAITNLKVVARSMGVELQLLEARSADEFDAAFVAMVKERVAALLVVADSMFVIHRARLADLGAKHQRGLAGISDAGHDGAPAADQLLQLTGEHRQHLTRLPRRRAIAAVHRVEQRVELLVKAAPPELRPAEVDVDQGPADRAELVRRGP